MIKYRTLEAARREADALARATDEPRIVIYCHKSEGWYVDLDNAFIRGFEEIVYTTP